MSRDNRRLYQKGLLSYQFGMVKTFAEALRDATRPPGVPLQQVALATGVSYEQLKKVRSRGGSTNIEDAVKVAKFFGKSIEEFLEDREALDLIEIVSIYNSLSDEDRRILVGYARGRAAALHPHTE